MLKRKLCEACFTWELACEGPLLVADGRYVQDEVIQALNEYQKKERRGWYPDKFFANRLEQKEVIRRVLASNRDAPSGGMRFYVPGTSIRGPFRAHAERIIRTLASGAAKPPRTACDPFEQRNDEKRTPGCTKRLEKEDGAPYAAACPACKLFGCGGLSGRIRIGDAEIPEESNFRSVYRDMIGIDRFTGGVHKSPEGGGGANMRFHALENTRFVTSVEVINFELWQLGLLAYVFRDFQQGLVPIGFGKTKGFGHVTGSVGEIVLTFPAKESISGIAHMGSLVQSDAERNLYGIVPCTPPVFEDVEVLPQDEQPSLYQDIRITNIEGFFRTVAPYFNGYMASLGKPAEEATS